MYSKYMIGNTKLNSKLPIVIFQINSISLIGSENLGKPRIAEHCITSPVELKLIMENECPFISNVKRTAVMYLNCLVLCNLKFSLILATFQT